MYTIENFLQQEFVIATTYLAQRLIKSDISIGVDLDKFEMGEKNLLLVCGVAGSGKTTIGKEYALANKALYVNLDEIWWKIFDDRGYQTQNIPNVANSELQAINQVTVDFALKKVGKRRAVIEGLSIFLAPKPYAEKVLAEHAVIFLGTSLIISGFREITSSIRTRTLGHALKNAFIKNYQWNKILREHRLKRAATGSSTVNEVKFVYK